MCPIKKKKNSQATWSCIPLKTWYRFSPTPLSFRLMIFLRLFLKVIFLNDWHRHPGSYIPENYVFNVHHSFPYNLKLIKFYQNVFHYIRSHCISRQRHWSLGTGSLLIWSRNELAIVNKLNPSFIMLNPTVWGTGKLAGGMRT